MCDVIFQYQCIDFDVGVWIECGIDVVYYFVFVLVDFGYDLYQVLCIYIVFGEWVKVGFDCYYVQDEQWIQVDFFVGLIGCFY